MTPTDQDAHDIRGAIKDLQRQVATQSVLLAEIKAMLGERCASRLALIEALTARVTSIEAAQSALKQTVVKWSSIFMALTVAASWAAPVVLRYLLSP